MYDYSYQKTETLSHKQGWSLKLGKSGQPAIIINRMRFCFT